MKNKKFIFISSGEGEIYTTEFDTLDEAKEALLKEARDLTNNPDLNFGDGDEDGSYYLEETGGYYNGNHGENYEWSIIESPKDEPEKTKDAMTWYEHLQTMSIEEMARFFQYIREFKCDTCVYHYKDVPDGCYKANCYDSSNQKAFLNLKLSETGSFMKEEPRKFTWDDLFKNAMDTACGSPELVAKDKARWHLEDIILEEEKYDVNLAECPEDAIESFLERRNTPVYFDINGNVISL